MSTATETTPYVVLPGTSSLDIQETISSTSSLSDVSPSNITSDRTGSISKLFHAGGMFSVFGRGFLAEPVLRDEEESYRYLMALDRY